MSAIIERLARVLYERKCSEVASDLASPYRGPFSPFDELLKAKQFYLDEARVLIEALRELPEEPGPRYSAGEYSRRNYAAMIDDALSP